MRAIENDNDPFGREGIRICNQKYENADFSGLRIQLSYVDCIFVNCSFKHANLGRLEFAGKCKIYRCDFRCAKLAGMKISASTLVRHNDFRGTSFDDVLRQRNSIGYLCELANDNKMPNLYVDQPYFIATDTEKKALNKRFKKLIRKYKAKRLRLENSRKTKSYYTIPKEVPDEYKEWKLPPGTIRVSDHWNCRDGETFVPYRNGNKASQGKKTVLACINTGTRWEILPWRESGKL